MVCINLLWKPILLPLLYFAILLGTILAALSSHAPLWLLLVIICAEALGFAALVTKLARKDREKRRARARLDAMEAVARLRANRNQRLNG